MRAYVQKLPLNVHADVVHTDVVSGAIYLNIGLSLYLHPYCVYVSSDGSDAGSPEPSWLTHSISTKGLIININADP